MSTTFGVGSLSVVSHLGHQTVKNLGSASYTDYSLAVSKEWIRVVWSATLLGADTDAYMGAGKQNLGKAALQLGAKRSF